MRAGLTLIVVAINVVALVSILGSRAAAGRKLVWTAAVVLVPVIGALGWFASGRRGRTRSHAGRRTTRRTRSGAGHGSGR